MQHCCVCILGKTLHPEGILRKEYLRRTQGKVAANFLQPNLFSFKYWLYFWPLLINKTFLKMAYVISDDCITCGTCEGECPVGAISMGADHYQIDPDACTECGTCAGVCPVEAIKQA